MLKDDLKEIYDETLSYSAVKNIENNPYYKLISHRSLDEHLILSKPRPRILWLDNEELGHERPIT